MSSRTQKRRHKPRPGAPSPQALLEKAARFYHDSLGDDAGLQAFLRRSNLGGNDLQKQFLAGACRGNLADLLPAPIDAPAIHKVLRELGILDGDGGETLSGCLTLPILDADGGIVGIAGHDPASGHESLVGRCRIWNTPAAAAHADLLAAASALDGLALAACGAPNAIAFLMGPPGPSEASLLRGLGAASVTIVAASDRIGGYAAPLDGIKRFCLPLPDDASPVDLLRRSGPDELSAALDRAERRELGGSPTGGMQPLPDGFACHFAGRRYEARGIDRSSRRLKAAVRAERQGRLHVDTVDFYSARARRSLSMDLCRFFEEARETIEGDIARLIRLCEQWADEKPEADGAPPPVRLSARDMRQAEALGRAPDLPDRILADYEACGLIGEEANKLLCYLAAVSRKMPEPLSVLILSSSGAGKSALQDATLRLCPPEDVVKLTSMTGRALFYKGRGSLKHRILALEEEAGAEGASYPLRALISSGELVIETTVKDLGSGKLTSVQNRVEGPTAVFITTTSPNTDPETRSRFFVTAVDESREQPRRILAFQRRRRTLRGQEQAAAREEAQRRHRNFQRLLKPVAVINPFAEQLAYGDDRLQSRRDQPKLLNLIAAVAFLRQMAKPLRSLEDGRAYVEVDAEDMRIASELAAALLGKSLDELNPVSLSLLMQIERMVLARLEQARQQEDGPPPRRGDVLFTRRQIREFSGWPHTRVKRYLVELVDMEYLEAVCGRLGSAYRYRLCYEGQGKDGGRFVPGFPELPAREPGQHLVGTWSAPGRDLVTPESDASSSGGARYEKPVQNGG